MSDHDAVWAQTTDGGLLQQLFGHYPTVHEALIRAVKLSAAASKLQIVLDYLDTGSRNEQLKARVCLEWSGVQRFDLPVDLEHIVSLSFRRREAKLVTYLETWPGVFGTIESEGFEAILSQLEPGPSAESTRFVFEA
jgi:hypothetical protein